ncbi:MAG: low molecular weight phosphatase family protein [Ornithinimicrobium sp.]|uniref:arsenate reductase/protein-tyrosine-phosphatase family protein n=1 Tax=Ornithinimicrobium sp. TaxID=1977084 RepID=UPI003D9BCBFC
MTKARILVVCTGNICRSPFIERLLDDALTRAWGTESVEVRSSGVRGLEDHPMEPHAHARLEQHGLPAPGFRSRYIEEHHVDAADLVLTATRQHRGSVVQLRPPALTRTLTFREFGLLAATLPADELPSSDDARAWVREVTATLRRRRGQQPLGELDIVDPYTQADEVYDQMARQVREVLPWVTWALTGQDRPQEDAAV